VAPTPYFPEVEGFQWDEGNSEKNWVGHEVTRAEAEQVFLNHPLLVGQSLREAGEPRHFALGKTDDGRQLTVVFTMRNRLIRVISARPMSRAERETYAQAEKP